MHAHPPACPTTAAVGTVNKVGADYVGLLVLGFMNAAIAADSIRPEFRPRLAVSTARQAASAASAAHDGQPAHLVSGCLRWPPRTASGGDTCTAS